MDGLTDDDEPLADDDDDERLSNKDNKNKLKIMINDYLMMMMWTD